ncbi:hypothetical protein IU449_27075 [Nocardia higoensis]|uniref:Uncharacterized protein n=1 Tax=Nocardia higoensis TaxID=228599 RepID=A0ABS0DI75_9NOCA|nr:hypothetical protein [Nocardia higoensis]MBF6358164.1 hypothetical protein [Nocardia higoensis]
MTGNDNEPGYELIMPFVTVTSVGGPHEDNAYVAGFEMGVLDTELRFANIVGGTPLVRMIHTANQPQADLLAMKHKMVAEFEDTEDDEWTLMTVDHAHRTAA